MVEGETLNYVKKVLKVTLTTYYGKASLTALSRSKVKVWGGGICMEYSGQQTKCPYSNDYSPNNMYRP